MKTNKWVILLGVAIPTIMIEMAGTSVFVAFETIATDLNVTIDRSVWLTTLYLAANAMMLPLAGWLGKVLGYKRVITFGIVIFAVSAFLGGIARNFEVLVLTRALQGLGDGPIVPLTTALLLETFPTKERGRMMAGMMLSIGIAPAVGPLVASWVVEHMGWRAIFFMNVVLGIVSLVSVMALVPSVKVSRDDHKINWLAFALLATATVSIQLFLDRGQHYDWFASDSISVLFIVSVVSTLLFFVIVWTMKDRSVLDLKILKDIPFLTANIANMLLFGILYGILIIKILYLQWLMGFTPIHSGNYQAILAVTMLISSVIAGVLTDKVNPRWPVIIGLPVIIYGIFLSSRLTLFNDIGSIMLIGAIIGVGIAFVSVPISVCVFSTITKKDIGAASVMYSYLSVISSTVSIALIMIFFIHRIDVNTVFLAEAVKHGNPVADHMLRLASPDIVLPALYNQVMRQAALFSFNEVAFVMAFILPLLIIYLPFMKKPPSE